MKAIRIALFFWLSLCAPLAFSQAGWWTWMHGSNNGFPPIGNGIFGIQGVAAPTNDPPRAFNGGDWTDLTGNFWTFGGVSPLGDALWKFDPLTNMWTWVKGPSTANNPGVYGTKGVASPANYPGSRYQGMFTWTGANGDLWLYGGLGNGPTNAVGFLNDLWRFNITSNEWTWMHGDNIATPFPGGSYGTQGVAAPTNIPPCRREGASAWTDNSGNLWLFGGESALAAAGLSNDLWKYDVTSNMWTWMRGSNTIGSAGSYGAKGVASTTNDPPARRSYTHWVDKAGNLWMFGGDDYANIFNDLWKYDVTSNMWTWVRGSNTNNPPPAYGTKCVTSALDDPPARTQNKSNWVDKCGNFWMFGGRDNLGNNFNDLWHYDVLNNTWTWVNGGPGAPAPSHGTMNVPAATNMPEPRSNPMTFTQSNGDLWLFGGNYPPIGNNDMWRYVIDTNCVQSCYTAVPNANFTGTNLSGCASLVVTFTNTSTNSTSWSWNFGDGSTSTAQNPVHTYTAAGTYTVSLIAYNPPNSDTLVMVNYVTVGQSPVLNAAASTSVSCNGGSSGSASVSVATGVPNYTYQWSSGQSTSAAANLAAGNYSVVVTDASGCSSTQTVSIAQPSAITATITNTAASCNSNDGTATVTASGGSGSYTYLWSPSAATTSSATGLAAGNYSVTVTDASGCTHVVSTIVLNSNGPTATVNGSTSIQIGNSTTLNATGGGTYAWTPAYGLNDSTLANPTASPSVTTTYCVFVTDTNGCSDSACLTITVIPEPIVCGEFYIPNAFSPNNDNENDIFKVYVNPLCVTEFKLVIYNRWGENVFETTDVTKGWDGFFRTEISNTAVYAYYCNVSFTNGNKIFKKGNVSLVR